MNRIRAATYNVHKCRGMDGRVSPLRVAEVIAETGSATVALQEVLATHAELIARHLGMQYAMGANRELLGCGYGNVVLSRLPIVATRNYDLSVRGREERGCLRADLRIDGARVLHLFNVHLGTAFLERRQQARLLIAPELLNDSSLVNPRIVLGDFNEWTQGLATRLLCSHLESADIRLHLRRTRTYPGVAPLLHLDHIYHDPVLRLRSLALHKTRKALIASDHLPLLAEFTWEEEGEKEKGPK